MAEPSTNPLFTEESDDEALDLVRKDLQSSERFKREFWPQDKLINRRLAVDGDPQAFDFPYDTEWGHRPVNNWMRLQINHKVGKLTKSPTRLNLKDASGRDDESTRLMLVALRHQLERKGREARWDYGRRKMLLDAATISFGIRAIGLSYDRDRYRIRNFKVRAEEFHMDPTCESFDDAEWMAWRRYVAASKLTNTLARHRDLRPVGAGNSLVPDSRSSEIALADDRILAQGRGVGDRGAPYAGIDMHLVTDYYRKDQTQDIFYPCSGCQKMVGRSTFVKDGKRINMYKCPMCGTEEKRPPPVELMRRKARYPNGRHVRIIGAGSVDSRGGNRLILEDVFPFTGMAWYDANVWTGYSETQQLQSAAVLNNIAMAMVSDNAFSNAHPKVQSLTNGILSGWNNNPDDPIELSMEAMQAGGLKRLETGDVAPAVRILLDRSIQDLYLLAANSPESQGQAPDTLRSGVGLARVIAASEVGLFLTLGELTRADARFYRIVRDLCRMIDEPRMIPMTTPDGTPGTFDYDRSLMTPNVEVEVLTERDVDQEREELFSRAVEMRGIGVQSIDDDMLLELSGIPEDIVQRAKERARMQLAMNQNAGLSPVIGGEGGNGNGQPAMPNRLAGMRAPKQTRPPSRSRGAETPEAAFGGR